MGIRAFASKFKGTLINVGLAGALIAVFFYFDHTTNDVAQISELAPDFSVRQVVGGSGNLTLESFRGRPVIVNFWASWCKACREEQPMLRRLHELKVAPVLGIATGDSEEAVRRTEQASSHGYALALDQEDRAAQKFGITALPTTLVLGRDGRILRRIPRALRDADVRALEALLKDLTVATKLESDKHESYKHEPENGGKL